jgi:hypothetical protein
MRSADALKVRAIADRSAQTKPAEPPTPQRRARCKTECNSNAGWMRDFLTVASNGDFLAPLDQVEQLTEFVLCSKVPISRMS